MSEEPQTPKEIAEHRAEMAIRDAWLAVTDTCNLFKDPLARPVIERQSDEIRSMQTKLAFLAAAIEVSTENRSAA